MFYGKNDEVVIEDLYRTSVKSKSFYKMNISQKNISISFNQYLKRIKTTSIVYEKQKKDTNFTIHETINNYDFLTAVSQPTSH